MAIRNIKHRRFWLALTFVIAIFAFYIITVGLAFAIAGNIEVGRLPWLRSDKTLDMLDAYVLPARSLARVPGVGWLFNVSADFWKKVTGAPFSIDYGMRFEQIPVSNMPKELMQTFAQSFPNAEIVRVRETFSGRKGTDFIFWEIRFKDGGKLREALLNSTQKVDMTYDVQAP